MPCMRDNGALKTWYRRRRGFVHVAGYQLGPHGGHRTFAWFTNENKPPRTSAWRRIIGWRFARRSSCRSSISTDGAENGDKNVVRAWRCVVADGRRVGEIGSYREAYEGSGVAGVNASGTGVVAGETTRAAARRSRSSTEASRRRRSNVDAKPKRGELWSVRAGLSSCPDSGSRLFAPPGGCRWGSGCVAAVYARPGRC